MPITQLGAAVVRQRIGGAIEGRNFPPNCTRLNGGSVAGSGRCEVGPKNCGRWDWREVDSQKWWDIDPHKEVGDWPQTQVGEGKFNTLLHPTLVLLY